MRNCWSEHAQDRPSFSDVIKSLEIVMTRDKPYVEFTGIDEDNHYYSIPMSDGEQEADEPGNVVV